MKKVIPIRLSKAICTLSLPLFLIMSSGCMIFDESELMDVDGRLVKVYTDSKGRRYYFRKMEKLYLEDAEDVYQRLDKGLREEAKRFDPKRQADY